MSGDPASGNVFGVQAVGGLLQTSVRVERILVARGRSAAKLQPLLDQARRRGIPVQIVPRQHLDRLCDGGTHQGIVAETAGFEYARRDDVLDSLAPPALLAVLDGVQDPRNLGAILRTAAATGTGGVFLPARRAVGVTPTVLKAAAGNAGLVPVVREKSLDGLLRDLEERGIWRVALDAGGDPLWGGFDLTLPLALVVGGEEGIRPLMRRRCDACLALPLAGGVESLNVSVAFAVAAYEVLRQRR